LERERKGGNESEEGRNRRKRDQGKFSSSETLSLLSPPLSSPRSAKAKRKSLAFSIHLEVHFYHLLSTNHHPLHPLAFLFSPLSLPLCYLIDMSSTNNSAPQLYEFVSPSLPFPSFSHSLEKGKLILLLLPLLCFSNKKVLPGWLRRNWPHFPNRSSSSLSPAIRPSPLPFPLT